jgi:hypothetical protein
VDVCGTPPSRRVANLSCCNCSRYGAFTSSKSANLGHDVTTQQRFLHLRYLWREPEHLAFIIRRKLPYQLARLDPNERHQEFELETLILPKQSLASFAKCVLLTVCCSWLRSKVEAATRVLDDFSTGALQLNIPTSLILARNTSISVESKPCSTKRVPARQFGSRTVKNRSLSLQWRDFAPSIFRRAVPPIAVAG